MSTRRGEIDKADLRISILKAIVRSERQRAEANPITDRNIELGVIDIDQPKAIAKEQILNRFNEIELLLDHLHISHLAAAFEMQAFSRLANVIGESRNAIKDARKKKDNWPENLIKTLKDYEGLYDVERLLGLGPAERDTFRIIRLCRNNFSHGVPIGDAPKISSNDTKDFLSALLDAIA